MMKLFNSIQIPQMYILIICAVWYSFLISIIFSITDVRNINLKQWKKLTSSFEIIWAPRGPKKVHDYILEQ